MPFVYYFIWHVQHGAKRTEARCRWSVEDALKNKVRLFTYSLSINMYVSVNVSSIIYD